MLRGGEVGVLIKIYLRRRVGGPLEDSVEEETAMGLSVARGDDEARDGNWDVEIASYQTQPLTRRTEVTVGDVLQLCQMSDLQGGSLRILRSRAMERKGRGGSRWSW